jgi:DNA-binding NtrC family response regulator
MSLHNIERVFRRKILTHYLDLCQGNRTETARVLGIQRTYLVRLLRDLNVVGSHPAHSGWWWKNQRRKQENP